MPSAITRDLPKLRSYADVRKAIDDTLGRGEGLSVRAAWDALSNVGRAVWLLDELRGLMTGRIHIHSQQYMTGELDGPALYARLAEAIRPLDGEVADLCRWVAERGASDRKEDVNESFVSVVNSVAEILAPSFERVVPEAAERWPEDLALESLAEPSAPWRTTVAPETSEPQFPQVKLDLADAITRGPSRLTCVVLHALWRANANDEALEHASIDIGGAREQMPESIAEWIPFAGDFDAIRLALFPPHPIDVLAGGKLDPFLGIVRLDADRFDEVAASLAATAFVICTPSADMAIGNLIRAALRTDPDGLLLRGEDLQAEEDVQMAMKASLVGVVLVITGTSEALETALATMGELVRVVDRRKTAIN